MLSDLRYAFRSILKTPGFCLIAVTVLTLGIGLNTAMFAFVHTMAFKSRPFPDGDQVVQVYSHDVTKLNDWRGFSYPAYRMLRERDDLFAGVLAQNMSMVGLGEGEFTRRVFSAIVSSNFFSTLGVQPLQGRTFTPAEEAPGAAVPVVIASYPYWKKCGYDPKLVGSTLRINGSDFTVIGIMPEGFSGTMMLIGTELYLPLGMFDNLFNDVGGSANRVLASADAYHLMVMARLRAGVTLDSANAALTVLARHLEEEDPVANRHQTLFVGPLPRLGAATSPSDETETKIFAIVLLALTVTVLLLVCLNLTGLLLARGHSRRREFAIRLALGSGRRRIIRQLVTEGFVLSLIGGVSGFLASLWATDFILATLASLLPVPLFFGGSGNAIGALATLGFCALATLMFALGPALRLSRPNVLADLKQIVGDDSMAKRRHWLPRHPLIIAQIAVSLCLLIVAGLFIRMAQVTTNTEFGYDADSTLLAEVDARLGGMDDTQSLQTYRLAEEKLAGMPGITAVSLAAAIPFGNVHFGRMVRRAGPAPADDAAPATAAEGRAFRAYWNAVGPDYFKTMGIALLTGRHFTPAETSDRAAPPVVIIDEALALKLWPEGDALGQRIQFEQETDDARVMEVVGIVRSTRGDIFDREPGNIVYEPFARSSTTNISLHLRVGQASPEAVTALVDPLRRQLADIAPGLPVLSVKTFVQHRENSTEFWAMRLVASLFLVFGLMALGIAVIGIYGIKAYAVARRTHEIGIRMALGANPGQVREMFFREGALQTSVGLALGTLLAVGFSVVLNSIFVDMNVYDPVAFGGAALALAIATLLACWLPARRATRVDPMVALRAE